MNAHASVAQGPHLIAEQPQDDAAIEALLDHAFGPGRFTKVSERVREIARFRPDLSFCAWDGDQLVGCVRQWQIRVGETPAIFLGPLAAQAAGFPAVVLVGDEPYFGRVGFSAAPAKAIVLPGPVDQRRVLVRALVPGGADDLAGAVVGA
jgi:predicted N-acetyltransferase YhbS